MTCLLDLPYEVIHGILTHVEPHDLAAVSKTCQDLSTFVTDDELLHKKLYLLNWVNFSTSFLHVQRLIFKHRMTLHNATMIPTLLGRINYSKLSGLRSYCTQKIKI